MSLSTDPVPEEHRMDDVCPKLGSSLSGVLGGVFCRDLGVRR